MGITKKEFGLLLDDRIPQIEEVWETISQDVKYSATAGPYYCLSSYAFTGTINYKKLFPKTIKDKTALVQFGYIKSKVRNYLSRKNIKVILYFDLRPKDLSLHFHGVCQGNVAQIEAFSKFWKRNIGFTLLKPIDDVDKWKAYCSAKLILEVLPFVYIDRGEASVSHRR